MTYAIRATDDQGRKVDVIMLLAKGTAEDIAAQLDAIGWKCEEVVLAVTLPEVGALLQALALRDAA